MLKQANRGGANPLRILFVILISIALVSGGCSGGRYADTTGTVEIGETAGAGATGPVSQAEPMIAATSIALRLSPTPVTLPATLPTAAPTALPTAAPTGNDELAQPTDSAVSQAAGEQIQARIEQMSQAEKIGQLIIGGYETVDEGCSVIEELHLGGVILFKRNIRTEIQTREDIAALQAAGAVSAGSVPLFIAIDQEGGRVSRLPASCGSFESARAVGDREDPAYARSYGARTGQALRRLGFNVDFAPVLDIDSNPQNTVIGDRAFGSTAGSVAVNGLAVMAGLESQGIIAGVKHFPGHGDTAVDSHDGLPTVNKSVADLLRFELAPFRAAIKQQAAMIMVAHIRLEQLDVYPASLSAAVVDGLLRTRLGFQGVIITDDLTMGAITDHYSLAETAVLAIEAGCDLLLICHGTDRQRTVHAALLEALQSGQLSEARIDRSLFRILSLKRRLPTD